MKILKYIMIIFLSVLVIIVLSVVIYLQQPLFGKKAEGERLSRIQASVNFKNGKFKNLSHTPELTEGYSFAQVLYEFLFKKSPRRRPAGPIPSVRTDLKNLPPDLAVMVWFGHSSYFIQLDGKKYLIDPVLSGNASPLPGTNKPFEGTDIYSTDDLPGIDYLIITHDHYDHLDYETVIRLKSKTDTVICGLGVGAHLEYWGYDPTVIIEKDWNEKIELLDGHTLYTLPARHFSGRTFYRNSTLWMSYLLQTPTMKIYLGGDSGYDSHYTEIGKRFGKIDLAILENGQFDIKWRYIHHLPEEVLKAARDLQAERVFPVHSSKFMLANHAWDDPLVQITKYNEKYGIPLLTPRIGEPVYLHNEKQVFDKWWEGI